MFETGEQRTDGTWQHTGKLIVSRMKAGNQRMTVTLPDDAGGAISRAEFDALVARVAALEARPVIDALEDVKYGN